MGEDDVGLPLKGFVVAPFETVSLLRRANEGSGFNQKVFHLNRHEFGFVIQEVIDTNHQLRQRVEPGKPGIIQY
jgi:primosomal protein N''